VEELLTVAPRDARLTGTYADRAKDEDGDGFNDALLLDVGLAATRVGTYTLSADLVASGQTIAHATTYTMLVRGTPTVTLRFDGRDIRRERVDGPYSVTNVYLLDLGISGLPAGIADDVWKTADYHWQDFGHANLYLPLILRAY
jgi:hypothetical protein